jgi:hypothetical protein
MAFKEVVLTEEEQKAGGGNKYRKFNAIGDKHFGIYLGMMTDHSGNYGPQEKHVLWAGKDGEFQLNSAFDLDRKIVKAMRDARDGGQGLRVWKGEGCPHIVRMTWTASQPIDGREQPMKLFKVEVDTEPQIPAGVKVPTLADLYPPEPLPRSRDTSPPRRSDFGDPYGSADDDIPF